MRSSGGPGSVSTSTLASSGKSRTVSADARVPCESAKCSSETDRGSADPPKTASRGFANPHKMAPKGSAAPSKSAPKGSAGPLKTAASKDDSSSSRRSHEGGWGHGGRRGVFAPQALHSFQQAPGATQAKSSRQAEQGGEEPSSLQPTLCPAR